MSFGEIALFVLVAVICGAIGRSIAGFSKGGCIVSLIVGFVGAYIGKWAMVEFNFPQLWVIHFDGKPFYVVWAIAGAMALSIILGAVSRR